MAGKEGLTVHSPCKNMENPRKIPNDTMEKPQQRNAQKATRRIKETRKRVQRYQSHASPSPPPPPPPPPRNLTPRGGRTKTSPKSPEASTFGKLANHEGHYPRGEAPRKLQTPKLTSPTNAGPQVGKL